VGGPALVKEANIAPLSRRLLYEEVTAKLRKLIVENRLWETYLPSERDLARVFRVNRGTIRKGLEALEERGVIARRHGLGNWVLPKPGRRAARRGGCGRVAVATSWQGTMSGYVGEIMTGLTGGAAEAGWSVNFFGSLDKPTGRETFLTALRRRELDGLILFTITDRRLVEEVLDLWDGPAVLVDHYYPDLPLTSVMDDSRGGARQVIEHFLSLGHRRIGYVDLPDRARNPWRYECYSVALSAAGIQPDANLVVSCHITVEEGRAAGAKLLDQPDPPTAVMAFDDRIAWGIWQAAELRGRTVGKDFALAGFGETTAATGFPDELSSVRVDMRAVGQAAAKELGESLIGRSPRGRLVLVPTELVIRKSSKDARRKAPGRQA